MTAPLNLAEIRRTLGDRYTIERELGRGGMGARGNSVSATR